MGRWYRAGGTLVYPNDTSMERPLCQALGCGIILESPISVIERAGLLKKSAGCFRQVWPINLRRHPRQRAVSLTARRGATHPPKAHRGPITRGADSVRR